MIEGFIFYNNTIEGYSFTPDAKVGTTDFSKNIVLLQNNSDYNYLNDVNISQNYIDLSNNIELYRKDFNNLYSQEKYNSLVFPDKTDQIKTTTDIRKQDINNLILQQNYIYIVGSITCATLLIAAIIIGKD